MNRTILVSLVFVANVWYSADGSSSGTSAAIGQPSIFWHNNEWETYHDGVWVPYGQSVTNAMNARDTTVTEGSGGGQSTDVIGRRRGRMARVRREPREQNHVSEGQETPRAGIGQPNTGIGQPNIGIGQPNTGIGQPNIGIGQPNTGIGQPNVGIGQTPTGIGKPNVGLGQTPTGIGRPNIGIGKPPVGVGQPPTGIGKPNIEIGQTRAGVGKPNVGDPGAHHGGTSGQ
jgi:hypothetical protein